MFVERHPVLHGLLAFGLFAVAPAMISAYTAKKTGSVTAGTVVGMGVEGFVAIGYASWMMAEARKQLTT